MTQPYKLFIALLCMLFAASACSTEPGGVPTAPSSLSTSATGVLAASTAEEGFSGLVGPTVIGSCDSGLSFSVGRRQIVTNASTRFRKGACSDISPGVEVEGKGARQGDGSVLAAEIEFEHEQHDDDEIDDDEDDNLHVEVEGVVGSVNGICPNVQFVLKGRRTTVDATTQFRNGACSNLVNGSDVDVEGQRQPDGTLRVSRLEFERRLGAEVELEGPVASVGDSCPTLRFILNGQRISTTAATQFKNGTCRDLRNGVKVDLEGTRVADGSIVASLVEIKSDNGEREEDDEDDEADDRAGREVEVEGRLSGLAGTCPMRSFVVRSVQVHTNSGTSFRGATCQALRNGHEVEIKGRRQLDGSILATRVEVDD